MATLTITKNGISKDVDIGDQKVSPEMVDDIGSDMESKGFFKPAKVAKPLENAPANGASLDLNKFEQANNPQPKPAKVDKNLANKFKNIDISNPDDTNANSTDLTSGVKENPKLPLTVPPKFSGEKIGKQDPNQTVSIGNVRCSPWNFN